MMFLIKTLFHGVRDQSGNVLSGNIDRLCTEMCTDEAGNKVQTDTSCPHILCDMMDIGILKRSTLKF